MEWAAISRSQRRIAAWVVALVLARHCAPARAQSPDPTKAERPAQGVNASATYDGATVSGLSGGAKRGSTYHGSLPLQTAFDFERLRGWANAKTRNGNGVLIVSEAAYLERPGNAEPRNRRLRTGRFSELTPYDDKYAIGLWRYTATFEDLSAMDSSGEPVQHRGSSGGYLLVDRLLTRSPDPSRPPIAAFLQLGIGDARLNRFESYAGAGLVASGLLPGPQNEVGIAIASARNGSRYLEQQAQPGTPAQRAGTAV